MSLCARRKGLHKTHMRTWKDRKRWQRKWSNNTEVVFIRGFDCSRENAFWCRNFRLRSRFDEFLCGVITFQNNTPNRFPRPGRRGSLGSFSSQAMYDRNSLRKLDRPSFNKCKCFNAVTGTVRYRIQSRQTWMLGRTECSITRATNSLENQMERGDATSLPFFHFYLFLFSSSVLSTLISRRPYLHMPTHPRHVETNYPNIPKIPTLLLCFPNYALMQNGFHY